MSGGMILLEFLDPWRQLTLQSVIVRMLLVTVCTGIIGFERGHKGRAAGLRTYILVSLGACAIMVTNQYLLDTMNPNADPARLGAQVINGIGFLGAGTILVKGQSRITGLTTAAGLWASACIGLAVGAGFYEGAVITSALILFTMTVLHNWEQKARRYSAQLDLLVELRRSKDLSALIRRLNALGARIVDVEAGCSVQERPIDPGGLVVTITLRPEGKRFRIDELIATLDDGLDIVRIKEI